MHTMVAIRQHSDIRDLSDFASEVEAFAILLEAAAARADGDPDEALVLLDGLLPRMLACWLARQGYPRVARGGLLDALAEADAVLAYRARLALRAPNGPARLAACLSLFQALFGEEAARAAGM